MLDEPLKGHLAGDSLDLGVLETISSSFSRPSGTASVSLDLVGNLARIRCSPDACA